MEFAFEKIAVVGDETAFAVEQPVAVVAFVGCTVGPDLLAAGGRVVVACNSFEDAMVHFFGHWSGWFEVGRGYPVAVVEAVRVAGVEYKFCYPGGDLRHIRVSDLRQFVYRLLLVLVIPGLPQRLWLIFMADRFVVFSVGIPETTPELPVVVFEIF